MSKLPRMDAMELVRQPTAFSHKDWIYEIKYDGFRGLAYVQDETCQLVSRNDFDYSRFRDLMQSIATELDGEDAIVDGEIVVLDEDGKSQFYDLMLNRGVPIFAAFDILWLDGEDLRDLPLWERKSILEGCLRKPSERILYVDHIEEHGEQLYGQVCDMDLEGIVCKPAISPYRLVKGRTTWIKVKNPNYSQAEGRRELFSKRR